MIDDNPPSAIPLSGYINDELSDGFKTPVLHKSARDYLQLVDRSGIVVGFSEYDSSADRSVLRPNEPFGAIYGITGQEAIYLFKPPLQDVIAGTKSQVRDRIQLWLSLQDLNDSDPSLLLAGC